MILLSQRYEPKCQQRAGELRSVMEANVSLAKFRKIELLDGNSKRLAYGDFFKHAAANFAGEVCVVANSDIQFNETAGLIEKVSASGRLIAMTRWESEKSPRMLGHDANEMHFSGSQDVWAFIGGEMQDIGSDIHLGYVGCDNHLVGQAVKRGYEVANPALSIVTLHVHKAGEGIEARPHSLGYYGYPELTTMASSGLVMCHEWSEKVRSTDAKVISTKLCHQSL